MTSLCHTESAHKAYMYTCEFAHIRCTHDIPAFALLMTASTCTCTCICTRAEVRVTCSVLTETTQAGYLSHSSEAKFFRRLAESFPELLDLLLSTDPGAYLCSIAVPVSVPDSVPVPVADSVSLFLFLSVSSVQTLCS